MQQGGHLAAPRDADAATAMGQWFLAQDILWAWIGLRSSNGQPTTNKANWVWIATGQAPTYDNWNANEPNNFDDKEGAGGVLKLPVT